LSSFPFAASSTSLPLFRESMQHISAKMTPGGSLQWDANMANSEDEDALQEELDTKQEGQEESREGHGFGYRI